LPRIISEKPGRIRIAITIGLEDIILIATPLEIIPGFGNRWRKERYYILFMLMDIK
jgi:hypothetical protein